MELDVDHCRHFVPVSKRDPLEPNVAANLLRIKLLGLRLVLDVDRLVQNLQHPLPGRLGLRIVINMEAQTPHRADDKPD
ncbi:hypothetical protein D3C76_1483210 [compost metagenome]